MVVVRAATCATTIVVVNGRTRRTAARLVARGLPSVARRVRPRGAEVAPLRALPRLPAKRTTDARPLARRAQAVTRAYLGLRPGAKRGEQQAQAEGAAGKKTQLAAKRAAAK